MDKHIGFYISKAKGSNFIIKGKCKAVVISGCTNCMVSFDSCVSGVEIINCKEVEVWGNDTFSCASFEKTLDCTLILNEKNKNLEIRSTASQTSTIRYPKTGATPDDDMIEVSLPETFITTITNDEGVTVPMKD